MLREELLGLIELEAEHLADLPPGKVAFAITFQGEHFQSTATRSWAVEAQAAGDGLWEFDGKEHGVRIAEDGVGGKGWPRLGQARGAEVGRLGSMVCGGEESGEIGGMESQPPPMIDGARVLWWAWAGEKPFGMCGAEEIYGFAVCRYDNSGELYRFSCDRDWETVNDPPHEDEAEAMEELPMSYEAARERANSILPGG